MKLTDEKANANTKSTIRWKQSALVLILINNTNDYETSTLTNNTINNTASQSLIIDHCHGADHTHSIVRRITYGELSRNRLSTHISLWDKPA